MLGSCCLLCCGGCYYRKQAKAEAKAKAEEEKRKAEDAKLDRQRSHQDHGREIQQRDASKARRIKTIEQLQRERDQLLAQNLRLSGGRNIIPDEAGLRMSGISEDPKIPEGEAPERQQLVSPRERELQRQLAESQQREQDARLAHQQSRLRHDASRRRRQPQPAAGQALAVAAATPVAMVQPVDQRSERPERQRSVARVSTPPRSRGSAPRGRGPPPGARRGGGAGGASGRV